MLIIVQPPAPAPAPALPPALSRIQGIVEKSSIKPIISNALIKAEKEGISVSATNLQIGMRATYKEVKVEYDQNHHVLLTWLKPLLDCL